MWKLGNNIITDGQWYGSISIPSTGSLFVSGLLVSCTARHEQAHTRLELVDLLAINTDSIPCIAVSYPHQFRWFCWLLIVIQFFVLLVIYLHQFRQFSGYSYWFNSLFWCHSRLTQIWWWCRSILFWC